MRFLILSSTSSSLKVPYFSQSLLEKHHEIMLGSSSLGQVNNSVSSVKNTKSPVIPSMRVFHFFPPIVRTGLVAIIAGILFFLSLFFFPLIEAIPIEAAAPAIIIVGLFMLGGIGAVNFDDYTESIPAMMTLIIIPFTFSIVNGIGIGSISYVFLKLVTKRWKEVDIAMYFIALLSLLMFLKII